MMAPPEVTTARLILVRPRAGDAPDVFTRYASDPDVTRYLAWPRHTSVRDTQAFLTLSDAEWERWPAGPYLIRRRSDDYLLGSTGLSFDSADQAVTGYVLARDAWGQGYATEALTAMVDVARQTGVRRLYALCHPDHRASWHVLEKCGFDRVDDTRAVFPNLAPGVTQPTRCYRVLLTPAAGA
jgi:RimJ/RimL family protein N-acetyltransferase